MKNINFSAKYPTIINNFRFYRGCSATGVTLWQNHNEQEQNKTTDYFRFY